MRRLSSQFQTSDPPPPVEEETAGSIQDSVGARGNSPPAASPVAPGERFTYIDILRGFAVFGILVANMAGYSGRSSLPAFFAEFLDQWIVNLSRFFIEAKFYSLFSLLFGWGMVLQMSRAQAKGVNFVPVYIRRMLALLLIGAIHAVFFWTGDILTLYAVLGLLLLLFRNFSTRKILLALLFFLLLRVVLTLPGEGMDAVEAAYTNATSFLRSDTYSESLYASGGYWEITRLRMQEFVGTNSWLLYFIGPVFSMFLLGLYIGKKRILEEREKHLPLIRRVMWIGLVVGLIFNAIFLWSTNNMDSLPAAWSLTIRVGSRSIGAPAMMLFYASGIVLLTRRESWNKRLAPLGNVGRMALTNYLLQSFFITLVFYGYGLGLYGQVDPSFGLLLTIGFFLLQVRWSAWWLERYQYGPMEWVWRLLTYGRRPPLRINEDPDSLKPLPVVGRLQPKLRKAPPLALLGGAWVILLLWAVGLLAWSANLGELASRAPLQVIVQATPTPAAAAATNNDGESAPDVLNPVLEPPEVRPLAYNPTTAAAAGDTLVLANSFDVQQALDEIESLSSPTFAGREAGSPGGYAAGEYIADRFERYRLQPAGDDGTFFQSFPVNYTPLAAVPEFEIRDREGRMILAPGLYEDFTPVVRMYAGEGVGDGPVVWVDDCQQDDFDAVEMSGKIAFCEAGPFGSESHVAGRQALEHGATGLLLLTDPAERPPDFGDTYHEVWVPVPIPVLRVTPALADNLLTGSGYTLDTLKAVHGPMPLATTAHLSVDLDKEACPAQGCSGRNVLGVIPGRDPEVADEVVVIGGHYDHLGTGPEGTFWGGANDNASGIATMLEIARTWDEAGYVPRRTVLFAAWDAEEKGLIGSQYYTDHPRFSLENTISSINMDMVGAGADDLLVDGEENLTAHLLKVAEDLGIPARTGNLGRSDHVPFLNAGIPANLLIWWDDEGQIPHYHRVVDTSTVIEPDKLEAAGLIAGISLLDLAESDPAIRELLERRATALEEADLSAYLETGPPRGFMADLALYESIQSFDPQDVQLTAEMMEVSGDTATAELDLLFSYPGEEEGDDPRFLKVDSDVKFIQIRGDWHLAGPDLTPLDETLSELEEPAQSVPEMLLALEHPTGRTEDWLGLSEAADERMREIAALLDLPLPDDATIMLFSDFEALRNSTSLTMEEDQRHWVQPGELRIIYTPDLEGSPDLDEGLVHLLLADAGMTESAAPWLWHGLPLAVQGEMDPIGVQKQLVPNLEPDPAADDIGFTLSEAWAATDFALNQVGWAGLGDLIEEIGRSCRSAPCEGIDGPLQSALGQNMDAFEAAWRDHWLSRLQVAQADLDNVMGLRVDAVLDGDQTAFLKTVDPARPSLVEEERAWFEAISGRLIHEFSLEAHPLAWLDDGRLLASINTAYRFDSAEPGEERRLEGIPVVFNPAEDGLKWSGLLLEILEGDVLDIHYPAGQEGLAGALLGAGESYYEALKSSLGFFPEEKLEINLYEDPDQFYSSIALTTESNSWYGAWTGDGQSIKIRLDPPVDSTSPDPQVYLPDMLDQMTRYFLLERGVEAEWLLKGLSTILIGHHDGGGTQSRVAAGLSGLQESSPENPLLRLADFRADYQQSAEGAQFARVQAWDSLRYFIEQYGWDSLLNLVGAHSRGASINSAAQQSIGVSLDSFEQSWRESLARNHLDDTWQAAAAAFDPVEALAHVDFLTRPDLAGRLSGTEGDIEAQRYIADRFRAYGLVPSGTRSGFGTPTFFQRFPITNTELTEAPRFIVNNLEGEALEPFVFRLDFRPISAGPDGNDNVSADIVWVDDEDYELLELNGEIIMRRQSGTLEEEIDLAVEHGGRGLVFVGVSSAEEGLAKNLGSDAALPEGSIPVFELTEAGSKKILDAAGATLLNPPKTEPGEPLELTATMTYRRPEIRNGETANILGLLPGSDPYLAQEIIIVGAHFDHVGDDPSVEICDGGECVTVPGLRYSGINDNSSGVAVLLEIARLWQEQGYQPQRSVLFAAWGANELGELGSRYFVENPTVSLDHILGTLQLDGVGGGEGFFLSAQGEEEADGRLLTALTNSSEIFGEKALLFEGSVPGDQLPFKESGYPSLLVQWRLANEGNLPDEFGSRVDPGRLGSSGRLVTLTLMALAGGG